MAHRIQPLHGSMRAHTQKRQRQDETNMQWRYRCGQNEQHEHACSYRTMLRNLMDAIQTYLLLSDDDNRSGAQKSLNLVRSTAWQPEDNRICIWLEEAWK